MSVHLRTPGELIASLPGLLGFMPVESIVVVGIGANGRVAPVVRVDRADFLIREVAVSLAATIAAHLARAQAESVVIVSFRRVSEGLQCAALGHIRGLLEPHVTVIDAWVTADGRFRSPECPDPKCCPDRGRPVPQAHQELDGDGRRQYVTPAIHSPCREVAPSLRRKSARAAFDRAWRARGTSLDRLANALSGGASRPESATRWRLARLEAWQRAVSLALDGTLPSDPESGKLAASLWDVAVRDAAVVDMVPGSGAVAAELCANPGAPGVREALSVMIDQRGGGAPDAGMVRAVVTLADHLAWLCGDRAAPALTLAGLALWWSGDDAAAAVAISHALAQEPGYRLAELVACALEAGMPPGWLAVA